ncbi:MAG: peptide chain release factor N(5)-glutamine methyltransferase [Acidobacteria bacterium]|nr:peptide chain release factor N(5)-glutamine methyltransferase [Acidobacteriota bacterium]
MTMENIASLIEFGSEALRKADIPLPEREASSILQHAIGRSRTFVLAHPEYEPVPGIVEFYLEAIQRRAGREPFHYITGIKEFYGLDFEVSTAVLIPRPETEMLVERAISVLSGQQTSSFCEVGVGSGCISVTLLANLPAVSGVGLEISVDAIEVARANSIRHSVSSRLDLRVSNVFGALNAGERFDLIVSNPPYVCAPALEGLQPEVRDFEPHPALTDGADGMSIIRRIIQEAPEFLRPGGKLMFEFGFDQADEVRALLDPDIWASVRLENDLQGIPRIVSAEFI